MENNVLTTDDLGELLQLTPTTIYRLLRKKEINGRKVGSQWRILHPNHTNGVSDSNGLTMMNVKQVATYLRVGKNTIYNMVQSNGIPHQRLGRSIRFSREAIDCWLRGDDQL